MARIVFFVFMCWLQAAVAEGRIEGNVELSATRGMPAPNHAGGVLVYVTGFKEEPKQPEAILTQKHKTFRPKILPVVKGQSVVFPNLDKIYHNVFSVSPIKSFNLGQYRKGDEPKAIQFDKTGLIPVFCNIHPHMVAYIAVLENNAFALTDTAGNFAINHIPEGTYKLHAWYEGAKRQTKTITISKNSDIEQNFQLRITQNRQKHKRVDNTDYPVDEFIYDE